MLLELPSHKVLPGKVISGNMFVLLLCRSHWSGSVWGAEPKSSTPTQGIFWSGGCGSTWLLQGDVWKGGITLAEFTSRIVTFWCPAAISESMEAFGGLELQLRLGIAFCRRTAKPQVLNCAARAKFCKQPLSFSLSSIIFTSGR